MGRAPASGPSVVMLGATGAVGNHTALTLAASPEVRRLTLLGRRPAANVTGYSVAQQVVDVFDPASYAPFLAGHDTAICTFGVGQPSAMGREEFKRIDHDAVLAFGRACREAGIRHFELLSSVGSSARSLSFYLRTKGELEKALGALGFERLSLFRPSMILTPTNRYGLSQAIVLATWPLMTPFLPGPLRKWRGIKVEALGRAIALNVFTAGSGIEVLEWPDFQRLVRARLPAGR